MVRVNTIEFAADEPKYVVKSVAKALVALQYIEEAAGSAGLSLTEVAKAMGSSKSSALATLRTLQSFGLVAEGSDNGRQPRYRLGHALIRLGHNAGQQTTVAEVCMPVLQSLSSAARLTARAAVLDRDGWAVAVARVDSPDHVRLDLRLGQREWPHRSGLGKALMSALPTEDVDRIVDRLGMPANTPKTIVTKSALHAELERARTDGFCLDDEEDADGIICVAAPVLDQAGRPFAALSVTGVKTREFESGLTRIADLVKSHAADLSRTILPR